MAARDSRHRDGPQRASSPPRPLDAAAREVIELFALVLARCNLSRSEASQHFKKILDSLPASLGAVSDSREDLERDGVPADVLTVWHMQPEYVSNGQPRPLPARGAALSVASIVRQVSRTAKPADVLEYLIRIGAVKQVGNLYLPVDRVVQHRLSPRLQRLHHLRVAAALLRTLERNARQDGTTRWYQFATDGTIPASQREGCAQEIWEASNQTLMLADSLMFRRSQKRKPNEPLVPVTLGIFWSEADPRIPKAESSQRRATARHKNRSRPTSTKST